MQTPSTSSPGGVRAVLIGPPGAGKTTVGRRLATALGVRLLDTDEEIERTEGRTIGDIFVDDGEEYFRQIEHAVVLEALRSHDGVLALGGGAVLHPGTEEALRGLPVVFLDVSMAKALPRVGLAGARPLLVDSPRARWKALMDARRPTYTRAAAVTVDTDGRTPAEVVDAVLDALKARR